MKTISTYLTVIILALSLLISNSYPQQINRIFENPGGGGGGTTQPVTEQSSDNTTLYVIGGLLIVGIVVYALVRDKKETPKSDTTAVILNNDFLDRQLTLKDKIQNYQSQIPINLAFGMQNDLIRKEEKRYFLGLSYRF